MFQTPILFVIYKNPEATKLVFDRIREIQPAFLYISADGSKTREFNDVQEIEETRRVTENIDWDCQVIRRYSEVNLGCKIGVSSAITWFFENVEQGIVLEYDCLPSKSFFPFCEDLLIKYKNNSSILSISGNCFESIDVGDHLNDLPKSETYYFSNLVKVWGWATWRRAWTKFDISMNSFPEFSSKGHLLNRFGSKKVEKFWLNKYAKVFYGQNKTTWAFIWSFCHLYNNCYNITPFVNLVSNIGFGDGGTHAKSNENLLSNLVASDLEFPIIHPVEIYVDSIRDVHFTNVLYKSEKAELQLIYLKSLVPKRLIRIYKLFRKILLNYNLIKHKNGWEI